MDNITSFILLLENDDTNLLLHTRLTFEWNEILYQQTFSLLRKAIDECKHSRIIPNHLYFFFTKDIPLLIGILRNELFTNITENYLPEGISSKSAYKVFIQVRISEIQVYHQNFIDGDIYK